jgi:hypothetical protein
VVSSSFNIVTPQFCVNRGRMTRLSMPMTINDLEEDNGITCQLGWCTFSSKRRG